MIDIGNKMKKSPSQERVNELFEYRDGKLYNKTKRKGIESGYIDISTGHRRVRVDDKLHRVHRLIWIMHNGDIPERGFIEHKNGIKDDNRIENLEVVTIQENSFNTSAKRVNELFEYRDGKLYNKTNRASTSRKGKMVGTKNAGGYLDVRIDKKNYRLHRLIWIMHNGDIPEKRVIDHRNGIKTDNRIENLRSVTIQENTFNSKSKGYSWHKSKQKYQAQICVNGVQKYLGLFVKEEDAIKARADAKEKYHPIKER
jgi:hypothetical protein